MIDVLWWMAVVLGSFVIVGGVVAVAVAITDAVLEIWRRWCENYDREKGACVK